MEYFGMIAFITKARAWRQAQRSNDFVRELIATPHFLFCFLMIIILH